MSDQRDVVVFLCDQLRADFLSLHGCHAVPTPNLDRLASQGVVFDRAITASAVCAPARASMMTGLYPGRHGVVTNYNPFREGLDCLPQRLDALGYSTGAFGKLHHNPATDVKGFHTAHLMEEGRLGDAEPYVQWLRERHPEVDDCWNNVYTVDALHCRLPAEEHYEAWIADQAIDWLGKLPQSERFLAWISFQGPHGPFNPPREVAGCCDEDRLPRALPPQEGRMPTQQACRQVLDGHMVAPPVDPVRDNHAIRVAYGEMIAFIDQQIGRVLDALEASGRDARTTFIFTTDHGDFLGDYGLWGKGNSGLAPHLEIPLVVANHPDLAAGSRSSALANNLDVPGTVLALAGDTTGIGQSRNLLDLAQSSPADPREVNFSEYGWLTKIAETATHRYAYYPLTGEGELFAVDEPDRRLSTDDDPHLLRLERDLLMRLLDFTAVNDELKGGLERLQPPMGRRLRDIHPGYRVTHDETRFSPARREALANAGLDPTYKIVPPPA